MGKRKYTTEFKLQIVEEYQNYSDLPMENTIVVSVFSLAGTLEGSIIAGHVVSPNKRNPNVPPYWAEFGFYFR